MDSPGVEIIIKQVSDYVNQNLNLVKLKVKLGDHRREKEIFKNPVFMRLI